jgi:hypothetical protein
VQLGEGRRTLRGAVTDGHGAMVELLLAEWGGGGRTRRETYCSGTSYTRNLTLSLPGLNPGLLGEKAAYNRVSYERRRYVS